MTVTEVRSLMHQSEGTSAHLLQRHGIVSCAVCCETLPVGSDARQLPCKHLFHDLCILKWLAMHSSCPLCRHELPTLDADYEDRKREAQEKAGRAPKRDTGMMYM